MDTFLGAATIAVAAAISISLWTFRVALATRGRHILSALIAGGEAVLFVLIFTGLVTNLGDPIRLAAYAVGVVGGTMLGLTADERLSSGQSEVRFVVSGDGMHVLRRLHASGWPVTGTPSVGVTGRATTLSVAVDDRRVPQLLALAEQLKPTPFVTVGRLRAARPIPLPHGFVQVRAGRRRQQQPLPMVADHGPLELSGSFTTPGTVTRAVTGPTVPIPGERTSHEQMPLEPRPTRPDVAIRDLRLASAELGEALSRHAPNGAVAAAVAAWLTTVAARLGRELADLPPTPVLLARAHAVVGRELLVATHVHGAAALAARARTLTAALDRGSGDPEVR